MTHEQPSIRTKNVPREYNTTGMHECLNICINAYVHGQAALSVTAQLLQLACNQDSRYWAFYLNSGETCSETPRTHACMHARTLTPTDTRIFACKPHPVVRRISYISNNKS